VPAPEKLPVTTQPQQGECLKDTIRVAGALGIKTVCTMSGLPAGRDGDLMSNWVVSSWPPETQDILRYQWEKKLLPFWNEIAALAKENGVERIALELHGNQYVYNVPSLLKLRQAVGPVIGANLDPSICSGWARIRWRPLKRLVTPCTMSMPRHDAERARPGDDIAAELVQGSKFNVFGLCGCDRK
jgi:hypothetical protein